jgi:hypothetical protein
VFPSDPALAPQQYQPFELNPAGVPLSTVAIVLHQPQHLLGQFVLPPGCDLAVDAGTAFPVRMQFLGTSIIPGQSWNFTFESNSSGVIDDVLPVFESFQRTISPAVPCAPPVLGTQRVLQSGAYDVGKNIVFPAPSESLRIIGTLTNSDGGSGYPDGGPSGTLVTILPSDPSSGQALSIPVAAATAPEAIFDVQIPYALAGPVPQAELTLSVQPWTGGARNYPSILVPFAGLIADAGEPTLHLVSFDGGPLVIPLPYDDSLMPVAIRGTTQIPSDGGTPLALPNATVEISSLSLLNCAPDGGFCVYEQSTKSDQLANWGLSAPPGTYELTVIPEYPASDQWFPTTIEKECSNNNECANATDLSAAPGIQVAGWVVRPNQEPFDDQGEAAVYSLPNMNLLSATRLAPDGGFTVYAPPGRTMLIVTPDEVTGYPRAYVYLTLSDAGLPDASYSPEVMLSAPGLLTGTVSVEAVDGGPSLAVPGATVLFYYVTSDSQNPDGGEIAIPYTSGITDSLGNFAAIARPVAPNQ